MLGMLHTHARIRDRGGIGPFTYNRCGIGGRLFDSPAVVWKDAGDSGTHPAPERSAGRLTITAGGRCVPADHPVSAAALDAGVDGDRRE
jgi:hypothetical protein